MLSVETATAIPEYVTIKVAARLASFNATMLYAWISSGRLGKSQGVFKVGSRWRIHWRTFCQTVIESGRFV